MAIILIFLTYFSFAQNSQVDYPASLLHDSTKNERRQQVRADSTGRFLLINRVFIIGNRLTRDQIIIRELTLKPGDLIYNLDLPDIIDLDKKKLINTRLFNTVEIRTLELQENKVDLLVDLNERWYTFPSPIFELSDRNFNEWWQNYDHDFRRVNYGLRLYQFNMRGRNETLRFVAQFGFQRRFELMYRFPYIDKRQKHGITIDLGFHETKNVAYQTRDHKYEFAQSDQILRNERRAGVTYSYRNSFYKTHSFNVAYRNMHVNEIVIDSNTNYIHGELLRQEYSSVSYQFNSDHRDVSAYPLKGNQFIFYISQNGLGLSEDLNNFETSILYSKYFDLKKNYYLSNNFVTYYSRPENIPYINFGVLGQRKQFVRGYELYVVEGPWYFLNKTTFKKLIFNRNYHWALMPAKQFRYVPLSIYLKTYADLGYVRNYPYYEARQLNTTLSDKVLFGTGLGVDVVGFYDIVVRFEYSFNAEGEQGFFFHLKKEF
ncbi:MAG: BamA/TamA family outer membrane protein [Cyclobacteriaceae bacterium]